MRKKTIIGALILSLLIAVLAGCGSKETSNEPNKDQTTASQDGQVISDEKMKITIGYAPFGMMSTAVAKQKAFYKKYLPNVEVEWFFGLYSVHLINNWIGGGMEISYLGDMPAIMLQSKVGNTVWVSNANYQKGKVAGIFVRKDFPGTSVKDLNGKTIATGVGSSHHRILDVIAKKEGITYNLVNQTPEVAMPNLESGRIDAMIYWPPYSDMARKQGIGKELLADATAYEPEVNAVWPLVVSKDFATKHPKIVEGLVRADRDVHKFMQEHPDEAAEIVFKELEQKIPLDVVKQSLASYGYTDTFDQEHIDTMQKSIDFLSSKGLLKNSFKAQDWADPSYVKAINGNK